ncbi:MAG: hypothetical protein QM751_13180 [Paludibacteraceae bacterium]
MKIVLIGAGNVAVNIGWELKKRSGNCTDLQQNRKIGSGIKQTLKRALLLSF